MQKNAGKKARPSNQAFAREFATKRFEIEHFQKRVIAFFSDHPRLNEGELPIVHSLKFRMKSEKSLMEKIERKRRAGAQLTRENLFTQITDLAGVRVLHLSPDQFPAIHATISSQIEKQEWAFAQNPIAYTWDEDSAETFRTIGLAVEMRLTMYTSIHYLLKPRPDSYICCELQVRTLFEEIWGELDHFLNYPRQSKSVAVREQLRVLAKLAATGTRLTDAILRTHNSISPIPLPRAPHPGPRASRQSQSWSDRDKTRV